MKAHVTIEAALRDPQLLGAALGDLASWATWVATLKAAFGDKLNRAERRAFDAVAGSRKPPRKRVAQFWAVLGRRSGKTRMAAALAVFVGCLTDCRSKLVAGEEGVVLVLAPSVDQARIIRDYALGFLEASSLLASQLDGEPTANDIRLVGNVTISIRAASHRTVRGKTLIAVVLDECAFFRDEDSASPDVEVYRAVLPALATTSGILIGIGSPYMRRGLLHEKYRDYFGVSNDAVLVITGQSRTFNPMLDQALINAAERDDPESAASEWHGLFRSDLAALFDDVVIDDAIDFDRPLELPFRHGVEYSAFVDPSGGRHDAYTICVGHSEGGVFICDAVRGVKPPFDPGEATAEHAALVKSYRCRKVTGDNYSGEWVGQAFRDCGLTYVRSPLTKSELYLASLPVFAQRRVRIPDMPALLRELRLLERRVGRSGKDVVDHPPRGGSDDLANAVCGALHCALTASRTRISIAIGVMGPRGGRLLTEPERLRDRLRIVYVPG